ncbi:hypothetical protein JIN85_00020 [Luteolibacter pohnpeiensis]|uniref:Uncharacterized protein n=1 Tax=Luteolibacter pohnpeiensis TaxID=454153 RepID=A0A934VUR2_9BACT|nr:hypothetical protein [Luteolibacter pohnpeiensis]MBK1880774.1 hypothetical protein [Luteolibacter pohnpeiensis]
MKYLFLLLPLLITACSSSSIKKDSSGADLPEPFEEVSGRPSQNDIARFLAGRPVHHGAILSRLQMDSAYQAFSKDTLSKWKYRASARIADQRGWEAANLRPLIGSPRTLFYPFGGPDLMHALALFPEASNYVLLGLEPAGNLPDLENASPGDILGSLPGHSKSMETQLKHGYFITKDMKNDLSNGPLQGVTPILLSSLALMDAEVSNVQPISVAGNQGIRIDFSLPGYGRKTVTYISGDVSNSGFGTSYRSWLNSYSGSVAYFKAASYLMQDSDFSSIKAWVLNNCRAVVQDDSGIPYQSFEAGKWDIHLFGNYQAPIEFFSKFTQPDLRNAYAAAGAVPPLPFGSGYQLRPVDSNLTVAVRR